MTVQIGGYKFSTYLPYFTIGVFILIIAAFVYDILNRDYVKKLDVETIDKNSLLNMAKDSLIEEVIVAFRDDVPVEDAIEIVLNNKGLQEKYDSLLYKGEDGPHFYLKTENPYALIEELKRSGIIVHTPKYWK